MDQEQVKEKGSLPKFGLAEDILGPGRREPATPETGTKSANGRTRREAAQEEKAAQYVTFFLDKEEYALPIAQVQEINRVGEITKVPNAPPHVMGVINLRGKIVPVIELKKRLKIGDTAIGRDSRIVVIEAGTKVLGLMVDRVAQVIHLKAAQIEDTPEEVVLKAENYVKSVGKIGDRMIILLELDKLIGKESIS
jgi:purine-binding chemotaxis protein CheW